MHRTPVTLGSPRGWRDSSICNLIDCVVDRLDSCFFFTLSDSLVSYVLHFFFSFFPFSFSFLLRVSLVLFLRRVFLEKNFVSYGAVSWWPLHAVFVERTWTCKKKRINAMLLPKGTERTSNSLRALVLLLRKEKSYKKKDGPRISQFLCLLALVEKLSSPVPLLLSSPSLFI